MTDLNLTEGFEPASFETWSALARKAIGGAELEALLERRTADGIARGPVFAPADVDLAEPLIRAEPPAWLAPRAWDIRVRIDAAEPERAARVALDALEGGASSLEIAVAGPKADGVAIETLNDFRTLFAEVRLDLAPIALDAGARTGDVAALFDALRQDRGLTDDAPPPSYNFDPLGEIAAQGRARQDLDRAFDAACIWAERAPAGAGVWRADGRLVFEAGGTEVQELAWTLACAWTYVGVLRDRGVAAADAFARVRLALASDVDIHLTIAKLRAARRLWARLVRAAGLDADATPARLEAHGGRRGLSGLDAWTNLIRLSAAGFAAAAGGADVIALPAFTAPLGPATPFSERVSRNLHHLLMLESGVGAVEDPAAGSGLHEALTDRLARAAWTMLQTIDAAGGPAAYVETGGLARDVAAARARRDDDVACRRSVLIGVSEHAALGLAEPEIASPAAPAHRVAALGPLAPRRLAEPFERLRAAAAASSERACAFLAVIGDPSAASARVSFTRRFLNAGGLDAASGAAEVEAWRANGSPALVILTGSDKAYSERGVDAAARFIAAGAIVWLAGGGAELEAAMRAVGAARVIRAGDDALDHLIAAHVALGLGGQPA